MFEPISAYFFKSVSRNEIIELKDIRAFKAFDKLLNKLPSRKTVAILKSRIIIFSCLKRLL